MDRKRGQYGWPAKRGSKRSAGRNSEPGAMTEYGNASRSFCMSISKVAINLELKSAFATATSSGEIS